MSYFSLDSVLGTARFSNPRLENLARKALPGRHHVFLSHSHGDADIVLSIVNLLITHGVNVYVDWLDEDLPSITSSETATKIKSKIEECEKFVVLLTEKSADSKWVPWELGYADGKKSNNDIALFPVKRNGYTADKLFDGLEYLGLYPTVKEGLLNQKTYFTVFPPSSKNGKMLGSGWLEQTKVRF